MFERFMEWLRSLFGRPSDPLGALDPEKLREKLALLDVERQHAVESVERKEQQRAATEAQARAEIKANPAAAQGVRVAELARQIVYLNEEIDDRRSHLDQIHQQRKAVRQFLRFAERAELMRRYGLDKILGRHIDLGALERAVARSVSGGVLDTESLTRASTMLEDALTFTRGEVHDPELLRVLAELAEPAAGDSPAAEPQRSPAGEAAPADAEVERILRELERDL